MRAIFVRIREQSLAEQFEKRHDFDRSRDLMERDLLRDALLLDHEDRQKRTEEIFALEKARFEAQVFKAPHLPRLILFD